jgi:hypothetical protein
MSSAKYDIFFQTPNALNIRVCLQQIQPTISKCIVS